MTWILDSGCAKNLTGNQALLSDVEDSDVSLILADGTTMKSIKKGCVHLKSVVHGKTVLLKFTNVEFVPGLKNNILSYGLLESKGVKLAYEGEPRFW